MLPLWFLKLTKISTTSWPHSSLQLQEANHPKPATHILVLLFLNMLQRNKTSAVFSLRLHFTELLQNYYKTDWTERLNRKIEQDIMQETPQVIKSKCSTANSRPSYLHIFMNHTVVTVIRRLAEGGATFVQWGWQQTYGKPLQVVATITTHHKPSRANVPLPTTGPATSSHFFSSPS